MSFFYWIKFFFFLKVFHFWPPLQLQHQQVSNLIHSTSCRPLSGRVHALAVIATTDTISISIRIFNNTISHTISLCIKKFLIIPKARMIILSSLYINFSFFSLSLSNFFFLNSALTHDLFYISPSTTNKPNNKTNQQTHTQSCFLFLKQNT